MKCLCKHKQVEHCYAAGRCLGEVRVYLKVPSVTPPGALILEEKSRALRIAELVDQAKTDPNNENRVVKILRRGYEILQCDCDIFHTLPLTMDEGR